MYTRFFRRHHFGNFYCCCYHCTNPSIWIQILDEDPQNGVKWWISWVMCFYCQAVFAWYPIRFSLTLICTKLWQRICCPFHLAFLRTDLSTKSLSEQVSRTSRNTIAFLDSSSTVLVHWVKCTLHLTYFDRETDGTTNATENLGGWFKWIIFPLRHSYMS